MDVNDNCSICKRLSDQMLMLSCVHDPCINCAATSFAQQIHVKGRNSNVYICEVCGQQTNLDSSTTAQLVNLSRSYVRVPTSIKISQTKNRASTSPANKKKETQPANSRKTVYFCKEHSEQEISYYCFTCQSNICPQCAIHGRHKDHEVNLIKKALGQVKGDYLEIMNFISISQGSMSKYKDSFLKHIKDTNEQSNKNKMFISHQFQNIRASLLAREKELLRNADELNKKNIQVLTNFLETLNFHYDDITKVKKSIEFILRKDEVLIFEEYKQIGEMQTKVSQIKNKSDEIEGQLSYIHTQNLHIELKRLNQEIFDLEVGLKKEEFKSNTALKASNFTDRSQR